jgi:hypothetical protein
MLKLRHYTRLLPPSTCTVSALRYVHFIAKIYAVTHVLSRVSTRNVTATKFTFSNLLRCADALERRFLFRGLVQVVPGLLAQALCGLPINYGHDIRQSALTAHISVAAMPGLMQFTRKGARSIASPRAADGSAPVTPTWADQPRGGYRYDCPVVNVSDSLTAPRAAYCPQRRTPMFR